MSLGIDPDEAGVPASVRVAQVVEASFAGVGRHVLDLSEELIAAGVEVDLHFAGRRADSTFVQRAGDLPFRSVSRFDAADPLTPILSLRRQLRADAPDIVHGHASIGGAWARLAAPRRVPIVYTPNAFITQSPGLDPVRRATFTTLERCFARRTAGIICVSDEEAAHARSLGLRPGLTIVVPNGVPEPVDTVSRDAARRALGLEPSGLVVGFVGRLVGQKGVDLLVSALPEVRPASAVLAVVGEGPELARLQQQTRELGVEDRVRWLGKRDGVAAMPAFDVFVLPSRYEGFAYVLLEALQAGVPVVTTSAANASAALGDGRAGVIVAPDAPSLACATSAILLDQSRRVEMAAHAPRVAARFTVARMADRTLELYRRIAPDVGS